MSGVEVAGLVLSAIPVIFEAVNGYKASIHRVKAGIRKREHVAVLSRALRSQKQSLEAIITTLLLESGCDSLPPNGEEIESFLGDESLKTKIQEYLGKENCQVFEETIEECAGALNTATVRIAMLVPSLKGKPCIRAIMEANQNSKSGQFELLARLSMALNHKDLLADAETLDRSTATLDRFLTRITTNKRLGDSEPSRAATTLAKHLQRVRKRAENLYQAISHGWQHTCHQHQAKIFLEQRLDLGLQPSHRHQRLFGSASSVFRIIFASYEMLETDRWHDIAVEAPDYDNNGIFWQNKISPVTGSKVKVSTPAKSSNKVPGTIVNNICVAMQSSQVCQQQYVFCLNADRKICMSLGSKELSSPCRTIRSVSLIDLIEHEPKTSTTGRAHLPWQPRMLLALKVASSFLQFLRTPWVESTWSAANIQFLIKSSNNQADLNEPFLAIRFDPGHSDGQNVQLSAQEELQELGILLLEIWHEVSLETRFHDQQLLIDSPNGRQTLALQWIDDPWNPLPPLYADAVHCCLTRVSNTGRRLAWDDMTFWKAVCENVIVPLKKNAQV